MDASPVPGLDAREFATLVWLLIGLGIAALVPNVRRSLVKALKALLHWKILSVLLAFCGYVLLIVWLMALMNLWNSALISETVFWVSLTGFVVLFRTAAGGALMTSSKARSGERSRCQSRSNSSWASDR